MFLEFLSIVEGGTPGESVPESFFNIAFVLIFATQNRVRSMFFGVFVDSRAGQTSSLFKFFGVFIGIIEGHVAKRVPEGLF